MILHISKVFGSRGGSRGEATEILTNMCAKIPIFISIRKIVQMYMPVVHAN